jgi:PBP1b-binding outer membrane lipoprotein LpoB
MKQILAISAILLFTGCSMVKPKVEEVINKYNLQDKVTVVCYDLFDKKECPIEAIQYDIDILHIIPDNSRFCLGILDNNFTVPQGMYCYSRDIIK